MSVCPLTCFSRNGRAAFIASLDEYDLLIIDDLGVERSTNYAMEQMFFVIDSRYHSRRPMIITTNDIGNDLLYPPTPGLILLLPEPGVQAAFLQKLPVFSPLLDSSLLQHQDLVRIRNGLQAVGDNNNRLFRRQSGERPLDQHLVSWVEGGRSLVKEDNGRVL